jgi:translocation and assembly module TamB
MSALARLFSAVRRRPFRGALGALAIFLVLILAGVALLLYSEPGRNLLAGYIEDALSTPGEFEVELGRLHGPLPAGILIDSIAIADSNGTWMTVRDLELSWKPFELLGARLRVDALRAGEIVILRHPIPPAAPAPGPDAPADLSLPPVEIDLDSMTVDALRLEVPVLGQPADLNLAVHATALRDRATLRLAVERMDGRPGHAKVALFWDAASGSLDIDAILSEPADGLVARLLNLPGRPPLDLSVTGDGPAGDWRGRATLEAGSLLSLESSLSISIGRSFRLAMRGDAAPSDSLGPEVMSVLGPRTTFDLGLSHEAGSDDWAVTVNDLTSAAIAARGSGTISPATAQIEGILEVETVDSQRLARLAEPGTFKSAIAKIGFSGPLTHPVIQLESMVDSLAVEGFAAARTDLRADLRPDGPLETNDNRISITGEVQFNRPETPLPALSGLLGENPRLAVTGARLDRYTDFNIGNVTVSGAMAGASLTGDMALDSGVLDASGQVTISDLAPLSDAVGQAVAGRLQTDFVLTREADGAIDLALDGVLQDASLEQPVAARLLGPKARFAGKIRRQPDSMLSFSDLVLSGKGLEATGRLSLKPDADLLKADYDIAVSDLGALGIEDPDRAGGTLAVTGKAAGPIANPEIDGNLRLAGAAPGGYPLGRMEAQFSVSDVVTAPRGEIRLNGETDLLPDLSGQTSFVLKENTLRLSGFRFSGRGAATEGALAVPLDGGAVVGNLTFHAADIGPWSDLAGRPVSGGIDGRVGLSGEGSRQDAVLDVTMSGLALDEQLSVRRIDLKMQVADLAGKTALKGSIVSGDMRSGPMQMRELKLGLDGPLDSLDYRLHASGQVRDRDIGLDAAGRLHRTAKGTTLSVANLSGTAADIPVRLAKPALLELDPAIDSGAIELAVGDGMLRGRYRQAEERVSMQAEGYAIPLASLWPTVPPQLALSVVNATASLEGPATRPAGRLDLTVTGVAAGETEETKEGLTLAAKVELASGRLAASGRIVGLAGVAANMEATLPAHLSLAPAALTIDENAPLSGRIVYLGPIEPSWSLLSLDRHKLEGEGDIAIALSGTLSDPRISGRVAMADGRYENLDTGTILSDIQVAMRPSNSSVTIDKAVARDGGKGEISLSGGVEFGGDELMAMDMQANFRKARLIRRDELNAMASGQLTLRGTAARREISGRLEVEEAEIRLVGGLPPDVVEIAVEETGTPPAGAAKAPVPVRPSRTDLDLEISMPKRVFVRGRGLDSEWGGALKVTGTTAAPRVQGELHPLRGRYDFAGKIFNLRKGSIAFAGNDEIDPLLDLSAEREATDLTAIIRVKGTAKKPVVSLESIPDYPQDEVLARVLFNKSTGRLSAAEALQLAQAVGTLTGVSDGGGIMDFARGMLNLDVLRFQGGDQEGDGGAEAGKYLSDRVYVGVEGTAAGETGVTVEIEITPRLKLDSDVGQKDKSQIGLKWKRDY